MSVTDREQLETALNDLLDHTDITESRQLKPEFFARVRERLGVSGQHDVGNVFIFGQFAFALVPSFDEHRFELKAVGRGYDEDDEEDDT